MRTCQLCARAVVTDGNAKGREAQTRSGRHACGEEIARGRASVAMASQDKGNRYGRTLVDRVISVEELEQGEDLPV